MDTPITIQDAYIRASYLCSKQEKCTADISEKLRLWGLGKDEAEGVIKKLLEERFIDNRRFAAAFVREKLHINRWGRKKIAFMLKSKHIDQDIIDESLEEFASEGYSESLEDLLAKKKRTIKFKDAYDLKVKLMRFGFSRGFESNELERAVNKIMRDGE